jgi:exodeoxyribonuclease III
MTRLNIISWNVNGLRSFIINNKPCSKFREGSEIDPESNLAELITKTDANILCFQETRCGQDKMSLFNIPDWDIYSSSSEGTGGRAPNRYSGVSIWINKSLGKPQNIYNILPTLTDLTPSDKEGRFIALQFSNFIVINTYVPNAGTNMEYRTCRWDPAMKCYLELLKSQPLPVFWIGDLNCALTPYDVWFGQYRNRKKLEGEELVKYHSTDKMKGNNSSPGFTLIEREGLNNILKAGYIDCWRHQNGKNIFGGYTWWNQKIPQFRLSDKGWRIDYIITREQDIDKMISFKRLPEIGLKSKYISNKFGSDHCPITASFAL